MRNLLRWHEIRHYFMLALPRKGYSAGWMIPPTQNPRHGHQTRQNRCPSDPRTGNGSQAPQDGLNTPRTTSGWPGWGALASAQANAQAEGAKAFEALVQQGLECRRTQALARSNGPKRRSTWTA
jgi:hypothetical protein